MPSDPKPTEVESDRKKAIQKVLDEIGEEGVSVLIASGSQVEVCTDWSAIVVFNGPVEPELEKLVPIGHGLGDILLWFEYSDWDDGDTLTIRSEHYSAAQLDNIDTEV